MNKPAIAAIPPQPLSTLGSCGTHTKLLTPKVIHPGQRFRNGRWVRTLRTACFSKVRVCPSLSFSVMESAAAESKRPLIFRLPW